MKVVFLSNEWPPAAHGGIGSFLSDVGPFLVERGHRVTVIGVYPEVGPCADRDRGVRVIRLAQGRLGRRLGFLRERWRLADAVRWLARREGVDIVEAPETGGWSVGLSPGIPVVVRLHSPARYVQRLTGRRRGRLLALCEDLAIRRARAVIGVSQWVARRATQDYPLAGLEKRHIEVIYNGVDVDLFGVQPWGARVPNRIVFAGSLKPQKGIITLLQAFEKVLRVVSKAELVVAGSDTTWRGDSYQAFAQRAARLDANALARVSWRGFVPRQRLPELYASAAVCVFPSMAESFGLVAAEAMAVGRPVVYSRSSAGPELIDHGVNGFLANPEDPEDVARAILEVLCGEDEGRAIAERAAADVRQRFTVAKCAHRTVALYRQVLEARAGAAWKTNQGSESDTAAE